MGKNQQQSRQCLRALENSILGNFLRGVRGHALRKILKFTDEIVRIQAKT